MSFPEWMGVERMKTLTDLYQEWLELCYSKTEKASVICQRSGADDGERPAVSTEPSSEPPSAVPNSSGSGLTVADPNLVPLPPSEGDDAGLQALPSNPQANNHLSPEPAQLRADDGHTGRETVFTFMPNYDPSLELAQLPPNDGHTGRGTSPSPNSSVAGDDSVPDATGACEGDTTPEQTSVGTIEPNVTPPEAPARRVSTRHKSSTATSAAIDKVLQNLSDEDTDTDSSDDDSSDGFSDSSSSSEDEASLDESDDSGAARQTLGRKLRGNHRTRERYLGKMVPTAREGDRRRRGRAEGRNHKGIVLPVRTTKEISGRRRFCGRTRGTNPRARGCRLRHLIRDVRL